MSFVVPCKIQRCNFGTLVKEEWKKRQWPVGRWVYDYISGERAILVTTTIHSKDRMRHLVEHPLYKAFVVYDVAR